MRKFRRLDVVIWSVQLSCKGRPLSVDDSDCAVRELTLAAVWNILVKLAWDTETHRSRNHGKACQKCPRPLLLGFPRHFILSVQFITERPNWQGFMSKRCTLPIQTPPNIHSPTFLMSPCKSNSTSSMNPAPNKTSTPVKSQTTKTPHT